MCANRAAKTRWTASPASLPAPTPRTCTWIRLVARATTSSSNKSFESAAARPSEQWVLSLPSSHFKVERGLGCRGHRCNLFPRPAPSLLRLLSPLTKLHRHLSGREGGREAGLKRPCLHKRQTAFTSFPTFSPGRMAPPTDCSAAPCACDRKLYWATCSHPKFRMPIHAGLDASCMVIHAKYCYALISCRN